VRLRGLVTRDTRLPNGEFYTIKAGEEITVSDSDTDLVEYWREVARGGAAQVIEDKTYKPTPPDNDADESFWREWAMRVHGLSVKEVNNLSKEQLQKKYGKELTS